MILEENVLFLSACRGKGTTILSDATRFVSGIKDFFGYHYGDSMVGKNIVIFFF